MCSRAVGPCATPVGLCSMRAPGRHNWRAHLLLQKSPRDAVKILCTETTTQSSQINKLKKINECLLNLPGHRGEGLWVLPGEHLGLGHYCLGLQIREKTAEPGWVGGKPDGLCSEQPAVSEVRRADPGLPASL